MTNMQLAYSEFLENARHNRVAEDTSRMDVVEKQRHNIQSESLTQAQQQLDRYLGELSNAAKMHQIATDKEIKQLEINTNRVLKEFQNNLSYDEFKNVQQKTWAEIAKLKSEAKKNEKAAEKYDQLTDAQIADYEAKAAASNAKAYGTIEGILANAGGKEAATGIRSGVNAVVNVVKPEKDPVNILQRRYAVNATGGSTTKNTYKQNYKK